MASAESPPVVDLSCLLQPLRVGPVTLKNRIYVSSHAYGFVNDGAPTSDFGPYVSRRLRGGASLVVLGETLAAEQLSYGAAGWSEAVSGPQLDAFYDEVATEAKHVGAHVFDQLFHPGGQVWQGPGTAAFAPSRVYHGTSGFLPWELGAQQIAATINAFAEAAARAQTAGLSGVEVKADQGKLHHQFLAPSFNQREGAYGGGPSGRARFLIDTLAAIRERTGSGFAVGVRLPASDGDSLPSEAPPTLPLWLLDAVERIVAEGTADYISLSIGTNSTRDGYRAGHADETLAAVNGRPQFLALRSACSLPLFVSSNIRRPSEAAAIVANGEADMVAMTRAQIADPDLVSKIARGEPHRVIPCIACNQGCVGNTWVGRAVRCTVNPDTGRERATALARFAPPDRPHRAVAVVGGGASGLEAARRLAEQGVSTTVFEAREQCGGQLLLACRVEGRREFARFLEHQVAAACDAGVNLQTHTAIENVKALLDDWDHVLIATGSLDPSPWSAGIRRPGEEDGSVAWYSAAAVADGRLGAEHQRVVVLDLDWTQSALGIAAGLAAKGHVVTYVTPLRSPGGETNVVSETAWLRALRRLGASVRTGAEVVSALGGAVVVHDLIASTLESIEASALVVAATRDPSPHRAAGLESERLSFIGDAMFPRGLQYALSDAADAVALILAV